MSRRQAREIALQALYQLEINCAESAEQEEMYENLALDTAFLGQLRNEGFVLNIVYIRLDSLISDISDSLEHTLFGRIDNSILLCIEVDNNKVGIGL